MDENMVTFKLNVLSVNFFVWEVVSGFGVIFLDPTGSGSTTLNETFSFNILAASSGGEFSYFSNKEFQSSHLTFCYSEKLQKHAEI